MLQTLLAEGRPLLADGATGTNLFAMGLAAGETPELWNAAHPDRTQALHQDRIIAELNDAIMAQWRKIDALERQVGKLLDEIQSVRRRATHTSEPPPPHY